MKKFLFAALSLALFSPLVSQVNLNSSLTACYALNNSGFEPINGFTGTLSAVSPTVDRNNNAASALYFNGTPTCFVRLPDNPLLKPADAISFSCWVKPNNSGAAHLIYTRNNLSSNFEAYQLCVFSGAPVFRLNKSSSSGNDIVLSTTTVTPGQWYHLVGTFNNSSLTLYVNGNLEGSTTSSFNGFDYMIGREIFLGATNEFFTAPFNGSMDNVRFYNRVIDAAEVLALYNQDPPCVAPLTPPAASFAITPTTVCAGGSIQFTDLSTNTPTAWVWTVPGSAAVTSTLQNPVFNFPTAGTYTATLIATNSSGNGTVSMALSILPLPVLSVLATKTLICYNSQVNSTISVSGASTYSWSTGQLITSIVVSPTVTTTYTVTGYDANGCANTSSVKIVVIVCEPNSIAKSYKDDLSVQVYPNPFQSNIQVTYKGEKSVEYTIVDLLGKNMAMGVLKSEQENKIELGDLPRGIYFFTIKSSGKSQSVKIVKE